MNDDEKRLLLETAKAASFAVAALTYLIIDKKTERQINEPLLDLIKRVEAQIV